MKKIILGALTAGLLATSASAVSVEAIGGSFNGISDNGVKVIDSSYVNIADNGFVIETSGQMTKEGQFDANVNLQSTFHGGFIYKAGAGVESFKANTVATVVDSKYPDPDAQTSVQKSFTQAYANVGVSTFLDTDVNVATNLKVGKDKATASLSVTKYFENRVYTRITLEKSKLFDNDLIEPSNSGNIAIGYTF